MSDLAQAASIDRSTIYRYERGRQDPNKDYKKRETLAKIWRALEDAGIEFGEDGWVRVRPAKMVDCPDNSHMSSIV